MFRRNPDDERARRRLASGYVLSLLIHAVAALLFFAVVTSSSNESAQQATQDTATISVSRSVNKPRVQTQTRTVATLPHAPIYRFHTQQQTVAHQRLRTFHELAKIVPRGPSNAKPVPLASPVPNPVATGTVSVPRPQQSVASVPVSLPSAVPIASLSAPPTAAPTALPTRTPATPLPATPVPDPVPKTTPAKVTPAPAAPSAPAPSQAPPIAASAVPARTPGPQAVNATPAPLRARGIPSPGPTGVAPAQKGTANAGGVQVAHSPGPFPATSAPRSVPPKPIAVPATPSPSQKPKLMPRPARSVATSRPKANGDLNARLKALIPNNPVTYSQKRISPGAAAVHQAEPTPPPEVLARTKYIYRSGAVRSSERAVTAYVTTLKGSTCTGWVIRYPKAPYGYGAAPGPFRAGAINYPGPQGENGFRPIVEPDSTFRCDPKLLTPYTDAFRDTPTNP